MDFEWKRAGWVSIIVAATNFAFSGFNYASLALFAGGVVMLLVDKIRTKRQKNNNTL